MYRIERKPSYPSGSQFLTDWTIERPLLSAGARELYQLRGSQNPLLGIVIRSETEGDSREIERIHGSLWDKLAFGRTLRHKVSTDDGRYVNQAVIDVDPAALALTQKDIQPVTQNQAEAWLRWLISLSEQACSDGYEPVLDIADVLIQREGGSFRLLPIFAIPLKASQSMTIRAIATTIYYLVTGIDVSNVSPEAGTRDSADVADAHRWNKGITPRFAFGLSFLLKAPRDSTFQTILKSFGEADRNRTAEVGREAAVPDAGPDQPRGLAKVAGMVELKRLLHEEVIRPVQEPGLFQKYGLSIPNGILLFGPPGCGKTFISRQLAEELDFYFVELIPSEIASPFVHDTVLKIREVFDIAEKHSPAVIFVDEFEALVPARSSLGGHQQYKSEEVNEFLVHLNEASAKGLLIIAATNNPRRLTRPSGGRGALTSRSTWVLPTARHGRTC